MEPDLRSLPTLHDADLLFEGCRRAQGRRQFFAETGKRGAESLRRIDNVGGVRFRWNWLVGTGSE